MSEPSLEALFERFRTRGDASALAEVFDRTAPELLRVAHHLAGGLEDAEDLLQETFVTAIERARRFDRSRRLLPWLLGILANRARLARRRAGRSDRQAPLRERQPEDPARAAERAEVTRELDRGLAELPSLYRDVLSRHLLEGRRPVEIARELGRAPGTVRMQIARGLEQLRRVLPAGTAVAAALLAPRARGLASVRAVVVQRAEASVAASSALGSTLVLGGAALAWKWIGGGLVVACMVVLGWRSWSSVEALRADPPRTSPAAADAVLPGTNPERPREHDSPEEPGRARALAEPAAPAPRSLEWKAFGRVGGLEMGLPLEVILDLREHRDIHASVSPSATGSYEIDLGEALAELEPGYYELSLTAFGPGYDDEQEAMVVGPEDFALAATQGRDHRIDFEVQAYRGFTGRLVDEHGAPVELGWVQLLAGEPSDPASYASAGYDSADEDGSFELRTLAAGRATILFGSAGHAPSTVETEIPDRGFLELPDLVLEERGAEIRGRVELPPLFADRQVLMQAERVFGDSPPAREFAGAFLGRGGFQLLVQSARAREDGSFVLEGLEAGATYEVRIRRVGNDVQVAARDPNPVVAPASGLLFGPELAALEVAVVSAEGPVERASAQLVRGETWRGRSTDPAGLARFLVPRSHEYTVRVEKAGYVAEETALPSAASEVERRITVRLRSDDTRFARLLVSARAPRGEPLTALRLSVDPGGAGSDRARKIERDGEPFVAEGLQPGLRSIHLEPWDIGGPTACLSYLRTEPFELELAPGEEAVREVRFELGGRIRVTVEGWDGAPAHSDLAVRDSEGRLLRTRSAYTRRYPDGLEQKEYSPGGGVLLTSASELFPNLAPGRYELRLEKAGYAAAPAWVAVEAGRTTDVAIVLRPQ